MGSEDPKCLLGETTWGEILEVNEVYEAERRECDESIESIDWRSPTLSEAVQSLHCAKCRCDLLIARPANSPRDQVSLKCRACGNEEAAEEQIPRAIANELSWERYLSFTDGDETPYVSCPECSEEAYVISEKMCAKCGYEATHTCVVCGSNIPPEELDSSPHCGRCAHMRGKDD